ETPLLTPSGIIVLFRNPLWSALREALPLVAQAGTRVELLSPADVLARVPVLSPDRFDGAAFLPEDGAIDVHALLWGYLQHARRHGAELRCGVEVRGVRVEGGRVAGVVTAEGTIGARWVVNAAGAWAATVGALAGAAPIALVP